MNWAALGIILLVIFTAGAHFFSIFITIYPIAYRRARNSRSSGYADLDHTFAHNDAVLMATLFSIFSIAAPVYVIAPYITDYAKRSMKGLIES